MIELKSVEQMKNAIEAARANAKSLLVKRSSIARQYEVINRDKQVSYLVRFFRSSDGRRFGECNCKAGEHGILCKHIASSICLHIHFAQLGLFKDIN